ncbi:hypothetical protein L210DRAFT_3415728 [Boletus edulis BED1]|uniref:DUF6589 domain-containing protein n=1 Tax=Boletus edulis BED1 TaxID=1328754 RepID=A0AAD4BI39_BOLED|nr:hypothetical protein L210DRAFT_3415728 [Boletus edulis BED1]
MFDTDSESDTDNNQTQTPLRPVQIQSTQRLREALTGGVADKVLAVLSCMDRVGLNLPLFLDFLSWGDRECIVNAKIRYERTALMVSKELPDILERWRSPPRVSGGRNIRSKGARPAMEGFAFSCITEIIDKELEGIGELAMCPSDEVSDSGLTRFLIEDMVLKLSSPALGSTPRLWALLQKVSRTKEQARKHTKKSSDLTILSVIFQLMYARSHHHNRWPKFLTTFLRAQGISAKSLDLLHSFGLTMSHKWSMRAFTTISANALEKVRQQVHSMPFVISHDNVNIPFRTFSQRLDKQRHFDSGTAATVYFQPNAPLEHPLCNRGLQECRKEGRKHPITIDDIFQLEAKSASARRDRDIHRVLQFLVNCPEFDFHTYPHKDHDIFSLPSAPVERLPHGPQSITEQHILGTVHIEEASYEGNDQLIMEWFKQLNLHTEDERKRTGLERVVVWVGDQLTVERLRGLFKYRAQDHTSFDRLDWLVVVFGWFHLMMAFANSMHKQYLGTNAGRGLMHAFTVLERKGLHTVQTRGPFHQQLHDAIYHVTEARIRDCWRVVSWSDDLTDLRQRNPADLHRLATVIVDQLSSSCAVGEIDLQPEDERDEIFRQAILWNRDAMRYVDLNEAIRKGDVGIMEETLPYLLFRFAGGKNSKYTIEVLELLQCLHREWPADVKDFVKRRGWLMNLTGRHNGFYPIDRGQEHNIRDIKVTHQVQGPNASWDLMKRISPAIPTLVRVRKHMERQIQTLRRGSFHTDPAKTKDIERLEGVYRTSEIHVQQDGRRARAKADRVDDIVSLGAAHLFSRKTMQRWWEHRDFARSTLELWEPESC